MEFKDLLSYKYSFLLEYQFKNVVNRLNHTQVELHQSVDEELKIVSCEILGNLEVVNRFKFKNVRNKGAHNSTQVTLMSFMHAPTKKNNTVQ